MWIINILLGAALLLASTLSAAAPDNLHAQMVQFLQRETANIDGQVDIKLTVPDTPLAPCDKPQPFLPRRTTHLAGNVTVGLKCPGNQPVTRYFRAYISIKTDYFVAAHLIKSGEQISLDDLQRTNGDITRLSPGVVTDASAILGKVAARRVPEGLPLTKNMVRARKAVKRGDHVKIEAIGKGFSISTSGKALNSATLGGDVRVRTAEGATITGTIHKNHVVVVAP